MLSASAATAATAPAATPDLPDKMYDDDKTTGLADEEDDREEYEDDEYIDDEGNETVCIRVNPLCLPLRQIPSSAQVSEFFDHLLGPIAGMSQLKPSDYIADDPVWITGISADAGRSVKNPKLSTHILADGLVPKWNSSEPWVHCGACSWTISAKQVEPSILEIGFVDGPAPDWVVMHWEQIMGGSHVPPKVTAVRNYLRQLAINRAISEPRPILQEDKEADAKVAESKLKIAEKKWEKQHKAALLLKQADADLVAIHKIRSRLDFQCRGCRG